MCKPCTVKCKCKSLCNNSHNNGGTRSKCALEQQDSTSNEEDHDKDEENVEEILLVPAVQHDDIDTGSDASDYI